jgi:hypothetical protein
LAIATVLPVAALLVSDVGLAPESFACPTIRGSPGAAWASAAFNASTALTRRQLRDDDSASAQQRAPVDVTLIARYLV